MFVKLERKKRVSSMTSHSQESLYLQMSQQRESKEEEEENEAQDQPEVAQAQQDYGASRVESKQPSMNNERYGRIVKVQGGHVIRSIARKDRHSKIYTSKGPRDRRFRLSAQTAIEFYDVQDRLGFDRPSKAIDWLIHKAKASIEALEDSSTTHQPQHHQGGNAEPETVKTHQPLDEGTTKNESKEPVHDYAEEALNCAPNLSEANFMEMGWFQSLMAWNYNAGDGGEGCSFNSSSVTLL